MARKNHTAAATQSRSAGREDGVLEYNEAMVSRQYPVVVFFIQHIGYYRGLQVVSLLMWKSMAQRPAGIIQ